MENIRHFERMNECTKFQISAVNISSLAWPSAAAKTELPTPTDRAKERTSHSARTAYAPQHPNQRPKPLAKSAIRL